MNAPYRGEGGVVEGRVPPHDLDAEAAVLSAVMVDPDAMPRVAYFLRPEHFYAESHRRIFEACVALSDLGQPVDVVQVGTWLKSRERISQVGGMGYITEILNAAPAIANVESYGRTIHEKWRVRQLIATCQRIAAEGYTDYGDAKTFIDASEQKVFAVATDEGRSLRRDTLLSVAKDTIRYLLKAQSGQLVGVPTGYTGIDDTLGGLVDGEHGILAGRPGSGKTALLFNTCMNVTARRPGDPKIKGYGAILFSLEMPNLQLGMRAVASRANVDTRRMRTGALTLEDNNRIGASVGGFKLHDRLHLEDMPCGLSEMRAIIRIRAAEMARAGIKLGLVGIDYLQIMKSPPRSNSREEAVGENARGLKNIAKEFACPVVSLSQLNRKVEERPDKRPTLSDLRESGAIEESGDWIGGLYRDEYYTKTDSKFPGIAELGFIKGRSGPCGTVFLGFDGPTTTFHNLRDYTDASSGRAWPEQERADWHDTVDS